LNHQVSRHWNQPNATSCTIWSGTAINLHRAIDIRREKNVCFRGQCLFERVLSTDAGSARSPIGPHGADSFNTAVGAIDEALADVDRVPWIISEVRKSFPDGLMTPMRCTLCIDAFSINPIPRAELRSASGDGCNNSFLFQLTPLNRRIRVVPLHLHPTRSGVAGAAIREVTERVIVQVKQTDPGIVLDFVSVDGDEGYCNDFRTAFASILRFLDAAEFGDVFCTFICGQQPFWISDWLHRLKNSRTRLFRARVFVIGKASARGRQ
jgi:hypothetical protein